MSLTNVIFINNGRMGRIAKYIYLLKVEDESAFKIGISKSVMYVLITYKLGRTVR